MKKIKRKLLILLAVTTIILAACGREDISIVINADGTASYVITESIDKASFEKRAKANGLTNADLSNLYKQLVKSGYKLTTDESGAESYVHTEKGTAKKWHLTEQFTGFDKDAYAAVNVIYFKLNMKKLPEVQELVEEIEDAGIKVKSTDIKASITVEFPAPVVNTTGTIDQENPNKVSFAADLGSSITVFASTKENIKLANFKKPGKVVIKSITSKKKTKTSKTAYVSLKFGKDQIATGYQIQYSTNKNFSTLKKKDTAKQTLKISYLKTGTTYYFRVRTKRKLYNNKVVYGAWVRKSIETPEQ